MKNDFLDTTVILPVKNVRETAIFYKDKLGFKIKIIWDNPAYGSVKRGNVLIEFGEAIKEHAGSGVCYIHVESADKYYNECKSKDVEFVGDLADRDYGCFLSMSFGLGNLLLAGKRGNGWAGQGHLSIQKRPHIKNLRGLGLVSATGDTHSQQGRTNGSLLRLL